MRNGYLAFLGGLALTVLTAAGACSNGSGSSAAAGSASIAGSSVGGGASASGASSTGGVGSAATCLDVSACGGNLLGAWTVSSSCLKLSGDMDVSILSLGCTLVPVSGSLVATGSFVANADGTSTDNTRISGSATFPLSSACLSVSSVPRECGALSDLFKVLGWTSSVCASTNGQCNCSVSVDRPGGIGLVADQLPVQGNFTISGNTLTNNDLSYAYCAAGDTLTVTPEMSGLSGTVALTRASTGGAGGASSAGSGGAEATAGAGAANGGTAGAAHGGSSGSGGLAGGTAVGNLPCDIYAAGDTACVAAHSTVRALLASFNGSLYEVKRASDGTTQDIPVLAPGGYANSAAQDTFCSGTTCTITKVYDQSGHGNFLEAETPASGVKGHTGMTASNATQEPLTAGGHKVYSLYMKGSQAYWRDGSKTGMPTGAAPQGIYMVTSGKHFNGGCCFDYGNGETNRTYQPGPSMDAIYFGNGTTWGTGSGAGPWVMADLEDGVFSGASTGKNNNLLGNASTYVTAMEKNNGTTEMQLKGSDATSGALATYYKGALPPGKNPMKKQGAIVLGSGGDCCLNNNNASAGTFYEGAIVAGYPSDATDASVHANIVSAGYGK